MRLLIELQYLRDFSHCPVSRSDSRCARFIKYVCENKEVKTSTFFRHNRQYTSPLAFARSYWLGMLGLTVVCFRLDSSLSLIKDSIGSVYGLVTQGGSRKKLSWCHILAFVRTALIHSLVDNYPQSQRSLPSFPKLGSISWTISTRFDRRGLIWLRVAGSRRPYGNAFVEY